MKERLKKLQIKGFIAGIVLMVMISGVTVLANVRTESISVTFNNIRLVVNGDLITPRDGQGNVVEPFVWNGTTYLPVRAVADALGQDVYWDSSTTTVYIMDRVEIPAPGATPKPMEVRYYLESDIFPVASSEFWHGFPANGSFSIRDANYHRGAIIGHNWVGVSNATATYDISGRGFVRLSGTFGGIRNWNDGSLTVSDADSGRFLGGADVPRGDAVHVNIDIPPNVQRVTIRIQMMNSSWPGVGFGDAFFSNIVN